LDTSPEITYLLSAVYQGVEYNSLPISFAEGETVLSVSFEVYEKTADPAQANIHVERMHVFVDFQDGLMSIGELHIFNNNSDRTFTGAVDAELGQPVTLRFALPEGAFGLRFQTMDGSDENYVTTAEGFADTAPLRPGVSQQVLYGYSLNYGDADTLEFVRPLAYTTLNLNVLVPRVGMQVDSEQVELSEIRTVEGLNYLNLNGRDFRPGDELRVRFSGLQSIVPPVAASEAPVTTPSGLNPEWIAIGLAGLALVGGLAYVALRGARTPSPAPATEPAGPSQAQLERLLQAIAGLDAAFEAGQLDEASYHRQRQALKSQALALMQES